MKMLFVVLILVVAGVDSQRNSASCLGRCMNRAVSNSQTIQQNSFTSICRTYEATAECINDCNPSSRSWWQVGRNLIDNCNRQLDSAIRRNQPCYQRNLQSLQQRCNRECSDSGISLWNDRNQNSFCFNNRCFMDCLSSSLDRACSSAGQDLANVFYSPYDTIYNSQIFWGFYNSATRNVQPWCRPYFYDQQPGVGNGNGGGIGISSVGINSVAQSVATTSDGQGRPSLPADQVPTENE